jgi:hypothetical protein
VDEHQVPILEIEPMVDVPVVRLPIPRRAAYVFGGGIVALCFLWAQGVSGQILFSVVLPVLLLGGLAYWYVRPEGLSLDRWASVLWEYIHLPACLLWNPSDREEDKGGRRGGIVPGSLWR